MTAADLLRAVTEAGATLEVVGNRLGVRPASKVPPDLLAEVKRHKHELIAFLRGEAANAPLDHRARALPEETGNISGVTITDEERALAHYRAVARRAAAGEDEEREAIQREEEAPMADPAAHQRLVAALLQVATPLPARRIDPLAERQRVAEWQRSEHRLNAWFEARLGMRPRGISLGQIHRLIESIVSAAPDARPAKAGRAAAWLLRHGLRPASVIAILFAAIPPGPFELEAWDAVRTALTNTLRRTDP